MLFLLQGDDGPDVRGGSGDILLVHATETDRKGMTAVPPKVSHDPTALSSLLANTLTGLNFGPDGTGSEEGEATSRDPDPIKVVPGCVLSWVRVLMLVAPLAS